MIKIVSNMVDQGRIILQNFGLCNLFIVLYQNCTNCSAELHKMTTRAKTSILKYTTICILTHLAYRANGNKLWYIGQYFTAKVCDSWRHLKMTSFVALDGVTSFLRLKTLQSHANVSYYAT